MKKRLAKKILLKYDRYTEDKVNKAARNYLKPLARLVWIERYEDQKIYYKLTRAAIHSRARQIKRKRSKRT